jgi:hypothetical protein
MLSTAFLLATSMVVGQAEETSAPAMPKEVRSAIEFMAGEWESKTNFGDEKLEGRSYRKWSPDRTCLLMHGESERSKATGITGWDAAAKQVVETWYNSIGERVELRYNIVSDTVWEGTATVQFPGEEESKGTIRLERDGDNAFTFTASMPDLEVESGARRIRKPEQASPSTHETLKKFEYFVGCWEAKDEDGGFTTWSFAWNRDGKLLENDLRVVSADGKTSLHNVGSFVWDSSDLRVANHCIGKNGKRLTFNWAAVDDNTWMVWLRGSGGKSRVEVVEDDTFTMEWGDEELVFKRMSFE